MKIISNYQEPRQFLLNLKDAEINQQYVIFLVKMPVSALSTTKFILKNFFNRERNLLGIKLKFKKLARLISQNTEITEEQALLALDKLQQTETWDLDPIQFQKKMLANIHRAFRYADSFVEHLAVYEALKKQ